MSLRRDLYKGRNSTPLAPGKTGGDESNHWTRDWYDPLAASKDDGLLLNSTTAAAAAAASSVITTTTNTTASNTPEASDLAAGTTTPLSPPAQNDDETDQLQGYEVKTWIIRSGGNGDTFVDYDFAANPAATHIDLRQYRYSSVLRKGVNLGPRSGNGGGTNADGGTDGSAGGAGDKPGADGISATDIKSAVGGSGVSGDTLFSSSAAVER